MTPGDAYAPGAYTAPLSTRTFRKTQKTARSPQVDSPGGH